MELPKVTDIKQCPHVMLGLDVSKRINRRTKETQRFNKRTLVGVDGIRTGLVGEEMVREYIPELYQEYSRQNRHCDFSYTDPFIGKVKVEVKSRRIRVQPQLDFDCKVPAYTLNQQQCDIYVFTATKEKGDGGWILGCVWKEDFLDQAVLKPKGYPIGRDKVLLDDHYFIKVEQLTPIDWLRNEVKKYSTRKVFR